MIAKVLTDEHQIKVIREAYTNGKSTYQLADEYHCCRDCIWNEVKDIKIRHRISPNKLSHDRIKQIFSMTAMGASMYEIQRRTGVARSTVSRYLKGA